MASETLWDVDVAGPGTRTVWDRDLPGPGLETRWDVLGELLTHRIFVQVRDAGRRVFAREPGRRVRVRP